jgi:hypothetical protein
VFFRALGGCSAEPGVSAQTEAAVRVKECLVAWARKKRQTTTASMTAKTLFISQRGARIPNRLCIVSSNGKAGAGGSGLFHTVFYQRSELVANREPSVERPLEREWTAEGWIGSSLEARVDVLVHRGTEL